MSNFEADDAKELEHQENEVREQNGGDLPEEPEQQEKSEENSMPSSQEEVQHILLNISIWILFLYFSCIS